MLGSSACLSRRPRFPVRLSSCAFRSHRMDWHRFQTAHSVLPNATTAVPLRSRSSVVERYADRSRDVGARSASTPPALLCSALTPTPAPIEATSEGRAPVLPGRSCRARQLASWRSTIGNAGLLVTTHSGPDGARDRRERARMLASELPVGEKGSGRRSTPDDHTRIRA